MFRGSAARSGIEDLRVRCSLQPVQPGESRDIQSFGHRRYLRNMDKHSAKTKKILFIQGEEFIVILLAFPSKTCKCQQIRSKTRDREVGLSPSPNPHPGPDQRQPLSDRCRKCREIRFTTQLFLSQYFRWFNKYCYCLCQVLFCWSPQKKTI